MKPNLDTLKTEIVEHLEAEGFCIFHGTSRLMDSQALVFWDTDKYPDYKLFVKAAKAVGAKLLILNQREFSADAVDDALEQLSVSELPTEEQRNVERRLKDLRAFAGFTCSLELSFDSQGRIYMFDIQTEWYEEFSNLIEDLEFQDPFGDDDEEDDPMGGYFSKN